MVDHLSIENLIIDNRLYPFLVAQRHFNEKIEINDGVLLNSRIKHILLQIFAILTFSETMSIAFKWENKWIYYSSINYTQWRNQQHFFNLKDVPIVGNAQDKVQELTKIVKYTLTEKLLQKFLNESKPANEDFKKHRLIGVSIGECIKTIATYELIKTFSEQQIKEIILSIWNPFAIKGNQKIAEETVELALLGKKMILQTGISKDKVVNYFKDDPLAYYSLAELDVFNICNMLCSVFDI